MNDHLKTIIIAVISAVLSSLITFLLAGPFLVEKRLTRTEIEVQGITTNIDRIENRLDSQIDRLMENYKSIDNRVNALQERAWTSEDSGTLLDQIVTIEKKYVQDSWGTNRGECFTDEDYAAFTRERKAKAAVDDFAQSEAYSKLKSKLSDADTEVWNRILGQVRTQYQRTWAEVGEITRKAQTTAGQQAQKDIAYEIGEFILRDARN